MTDFIKVGVGGGGGGGGGVESGIVGWGVLN